MYLYMCTSYLLPVHVQWLWSTHQQTCPLPLPLSNSTVVNILMATNWTAFTLNSLEVLCVFGGGSGCGMPVHLLKLAICLNIQLYACPDHTPRCRTQACVQWTKVFHVRGQVNGAKVCILSLQVYWHLQNCYTGMTPAAGS